VLANTTSATVVGNGGFAIKPQTGNGTRVDISNDGEAMLLDGGATGPIIGLYGNGTNVGSIGTVSNTVGIHGAGSGDDAVGLVFVESGSSQRIIPCQESFTANNGIVNLGWSTNRFKDLYLSGGVYLGGTASANKLDDYEEGTFTPTANFNSGGSATHSRQTGTYTKIGRFVFCDISIIFQKNTGSGNLQIINLPFSNTNGQDRGCASFGYFSGLNGIPIGLMDSNTNKIDIRTALHSTSYNDDANGNASITDGDLDAETNFHFSVIYKTSA